jgi:SAM-dependent MidA family methyltransferase
MQSALDEFYARGGAGRRRDFITSPEVGPLFGAVMAGAIEGWWRELGEPVPFVVVDAGAGPGTLVRAMRAVAPQFRYVLVDRSAAQRDRHPDGVESRATLPPPEHPGVVIANELLDNLPVRIVERTEDGWAELHVAGDQPVWLPAPLPVGPVGPDVPVGARIPVAAEAAAWLRAALATVTAGRVVVLDYADSTASMARRPMEEWLRTYRAHARGTEPWRDLGQQDITCEVAVDQLAAVRPPDADSTQADWLRAHGIDALVAEGRRIWEERAHIGDLAAVRARSRVTEAAALTDPSGLGAFRVLEWTISTQ